MAGDFVIVQCATPRKPEILRIAQLLQIPRSQAFGLCIEAWMWFDEQTEDGHAIGVTSVTLDEIVCHAGFAQALIEVGWLHAREGALQLPNFNQHMGQSAKKRAKANERQQRHRRKTVTQTCDKNVTTEQNRTEQNNKEPPYPLGGFSLAFRMAWDSWPPRRRTKRETAQIEWQNAIARLGVRFDRDTSKADEWLLNRVRDYVKSPKAAGRFCGGMGTWLAGGCYDDPDEAWQESDSEKPAESQYQEIEPA